MPRFRHFLKANDFPCKLREDEAAPPMGGDGAAPPVPGSGGDTTNKYHFDFLKQNLGIDDDDFDAALEGGIQTLYQVPDYGWGFRVQPPVQAVIEDKGSGSYQVTFMLSQKKLANPKSFVLPYKSGDQPTYYEGPIEDKTVTMTREELADAMSKPFADGGAPPMGGGMGGGPPPMGGPPMGGM